MTGSTFWKLKNRGNHLLSDNWDSQTYKNWEKTKMILKETHLMLKSKNVPFIIVIINSRVQTVDKIWERYSSKYRNFELDRKKVNKELSHFCEKEKIYYLDLYETFHSHNDQESLYFKIDGHWNAEGHHQASSRIFKYFNKNAAFR